MSETELEDQQAEPGQEQEEQLTEQQATGARLVLKRGGKETDIVFPFDPPATIGRFDPSVGPIDIDLGALEEASFVSRKHAKIVLEEDVYRIQDLGSSNGTFVLKDDFHRVEDEVIKDGDTIALGNAQFVFHA